MEKTQAKFKTGDTVVMHTCWESESDKFHGKILTCRSDSYIDKAKQEVVFLDGVVGCFLTAYLTPVFLNTESIKELASDLKAMLPLRNQIANSEYINSRVILCINNLTTITH